MLDIQRKEFWHLIDGKWYHLVQEEIENRVTYWTNGLFEGSRTYDEDGSIIQEEIE